MILGEERARAGLAAAHFRALEAVGNATGRDWALVVEAGVVPSAAAGVWDDADQAFQLVQSYEPLSDVAVIRLGWWPGLSIRNGSNSLVHTSTSGSFSAVSTLTFTRKY